MQGFAVAWGFQSIRTQVNGTQLHSNDVHQLQHRRTLLCELPWAGVLGTPLMQLRCKPLFYVVVTISQGHAAQHCIVRCTGMLKVEGLLPRRCRMFDTPGVPHPFQLHARLNPEEVLLSSHDKARPFGRRYSILRRSSRRQSLDRATPAVVYSATELLKSERADVHSTSAACSMHRDLHPSKP